MLSADGSELWVTNELDASVSIVSLRDHKVVQTIRFELPGPRPLSPYIEQLLAGKTFVLTVTLPTLARDEAKALLETTQLSFDEIVEADGSIVSTGYANFTTAGGVPLGAIRPSHT